jgi:hypothetical protein
VDCHELRDLLLFLSIDLDDSDIPHRTKLGELIAENFKKEYTKMVGEISVSDCVPLNCPFSHSLELSWPCRIYKRHLVSPEPAIIYGSYGALSCQVNERPTDTPISPCRFSAYPRQPFWCQHRACFCQHPQGDQLSSQGMELQFFQILSIHLRIARFPQSPSITHQTITPQWRRSVTSSAP